MFEGLKGLIFRTAFCLVFLLVVVGLVWLIEIFGPQSAFLVLVGGGFASVTVWAGLPIYRQVWAVCKLPFSAAYPVSMRVSALFAVSASFFVFVAVVSLTVFSLLGETRLMWWGYGAGVIGGFIGVVSSYLLFRRAASFDEDVLESEIVVLRRESAEVASDRR